MPIGKATSSLLLLSGPSPSLGFLCSCSDSPHPGGTFLTGQPRGRVTLDTDSLRVFFWDGKTWRKTWYCQQSPSSKSSSVPHPPLSAVWENRVHTCLFLARCYCKQFSYPAGPEGAYYNRGRDRRPIYHCVVTLRENKLYSCLPRGLGGCQLSY